MLVVTTDFVAGHLLRSAFSASQDLSITRLNHALEKAQEDIIVLGSSRAMHHFVPTVLSDATGQSVYNCGFEGQGLKFSYLQLQHVFMYHRPREVLLELSPNVLTDTRSDEKLDVLLPFATSDTAIMNTFGRRGAGERSKFVSSVYPYNSLIFDLLYIHFRFTTDSFAGFVPLYGTMSPREERGSGKAVEVPAEDQLRIFLKN